MSRNVNVTYSNFRTGTNVSFQRRLIDVSIFYIDSSGNPQTKSGTITFPDILLTLGIDDLKDKLLAMSIEAWRKSQGID
jgi:hypothetical protein